MIKILQLFSCNLYPSNTMPRKWIFTNLPNGQSGDLQKGSKKGPKWTQNGTQNNTFCTSGSGVSYEIH